MSVSKRCVTLTNPRKRIREIRQAIAAFELDGRPEWNSLALLEVVGISLSTGLRTQAKFASQALLDDIKTELKIIEFETRQRLSKLRREAAV